MHRLIGGNKCTVQIAKRCVCVITSKKPTGNTKTKFPSRLDAHLVFPKCRLLLVINVWGQKILYSVCPRKLFILKVCLAVWKPNNKNGTSLFVQRPDEKRFAALDGTTRWNEKKRAGTIIVGPRIHERFVPSNHFALSR